MKSRAFEMQSYEFEVILRYMTQKVAEFGMAGRFDQLDLADVLIDHDVTTVDRLSDVVSLARNLQSGAAMVDATPVQAGPTTH